MGDPHRGIRLFARDAGAPEGEIFHRCLLTDQDGHTLENVPCEPVQDGYISFDLPPYSSVVLANTALQQPRAAAEKDPENV